MSDSWCPHGLQQASQAPLSFTISWYLFKLTSTESLVLSNHLILCCPLLLLPSIFPSKGGHFLSVSSSHQVTKVVELQLQHQLKIYIYIYIFKLVKVDAWVNPQSGCCCFVA